MALEKEHKNKKYTIKIKSNSNFQFPKPEYTVHKRKINRLNFDINFLLGNKYYFYELCCLTFYVCLSIFLYKKENLIVFGQIAWYIWPIVKSIITNFWAIS